MSKLTLECIFAEHCVLSTPVDYYCLVCEEQFRNVDDTLAHISSSQHKKDWKACGYVKRYKENQIKKPHDTYFCQLCRKAFPTDAEIDEHTYDMTHMIKKNMPNPLQVYRVKKDIIVFNQFIISQDAWHGIVDDTCVLCDTEIDDSSAHKVIKSHILNFYKFEVSYDSSEIAVYRAMRPGTRHCLICNVLFTVGDDPKAHSKTEEHKEAFKTYFPPIDQDETEKASTSKDN